jgi:three-Cys-motif partner protein
VADRGEAAPVVFDEIGYWSEVKLDIVKKYAAAYSKIMAKQPRLSHVYIDGFAGAGVHLAKGTGEYILGSPLNAMLIEPPFEEFFFLDLDGTKVDHLRRLVGDDSRVQVLEGNCNEILIDKVFPKVQYDQFRRGLCLLDPYGLHLNWEVMEAAGKLRTLDLFLNFPVMDMNMNALWHQPDRVSQWGVERMTAFWGDDSWRTAAYSESPQGNLFGEVEQVKLDNDAIAEAFRRRLRDKASFAHVPSPMPMRNTRGATVYYLFFASHNSTGNKIVQDVFDKHRRRGL